MEVNDFEWPIDYLCTRAELRAHQNEMHATVSAMETNAITRTRTLNAEGVIATWIGGAGIQIDWE